MKFPEIEKNAQFSQTWGQLPAYGKMWHRVGPFAPGPERRSLFEWVKDVLNPENPFQDSKGQTYCHPNCVMCRQAADAAEETIVVIHVETARECFSTDSPLVALLFAVNVEVPVLVHTEQMTRRQYQSIPATTRSHELSRS